MVKIAALVWIMLGNVLAGVAMTAIVSVPSLAEQSNVLIPVLCGGAYVIAMPIAYVIAKVIAAPAARTA